MATTYELITSTTLTSSASSVTLSSIPADYDDIVLKYSVRSDRANTIDLIALRINGSSSANYSSTRINVVAGGISSTRQTADTFFATYITGDTATGSVFSIGEYYFPRYTDSSNYQVASYSAFGEDNSTDTWHRTAAGLWKDTAAITSLTLIPQYGTNWLSGSSFFLYGIKNS